MSEEAELLAKIAALSGRINQQRQTETPPPPFPAGRGSGFSAPRGRGYRGSGWAGHHADRYAPYQHQHPRGGSYHKPPYASAFRNRTLVVNNAAGATAEQQPSPLTPATPSTNQWVSKRDRHMQLINTSVYDQKTQQRQQEIEATAQEKQMRRNEKEKARVLKAFQPTPAMPNTYGAPTPSAGTSALRDIQINDVHFRVAADGSKLIRMFDDSNTDPKATPKQTKVAGVTFHRSKNGNLYRSGVVRKSMRYWTKCNHNWGPHQLIDRCANRENTVKKTSELCPRFTATGTHHSTQHRAATCATGLRETIHLSDSVGRPCYPNTNLLTGVCALGNRCRYTHDPTKIAICKEYLRHGRCAAGDDACNLSHEPTPHRVPACTHFLRGNCTNPDCRYAHIAVSPAAPVCRAFATIGYCQKGADCTERHVFECPDYANTGTCRNKKCRLPHVDTAGNMRKAKAAEAKTDDADGSDLSSDEESHDEIDSDDVDSDNFSDGEVVMGGTEGRDHALAQQQDFVGFS